MVDGEPVLFEILDTCPKVTNYLWSGNPIWCLAIFFNIYIIKLINYRNRFECLISITTCKKYILPSINVLQMEGNEITNTALDAFQWADGILLVYSITDRQSFNYIKRAKIEIQSDMVSLSLVGNKVDMIHLRQVSADEGDILAKDFDCKFSELSAAENVVQVADVFHELCRDVLSARRKSKQSLLDRMLGGTRVYARGKSDSALPKD